MNLCSKSVVCWQFQRLLRAPSPWSRFLLRVRPHARYLEGGFGGSVVGRLPIADLLGAWLCHALESRGSQGAIEFLFEQLQFGPHQAASQSGGVLLLSAEERHWSDSTSTARHCSKVPRTRWSVISSDPVWLSSAVAFSKPAHVSFSGDAFD